MNLNVSDPFLNPDEEDIRLYTIPELNTVSHPVILYALGWKYYDKDEPRDDFYLNADILLWKILIKTWTMNVIRTH